MLDKIVKLENETSYVILDESKLGEKKYYYGLELDEKEEPTNTYLFFEEVMMEGDTYLLPIDDENLKNLLFTSFSVNFANMVYGE